MRRIGVLASAALLLAVLSAHGLDHELRVHLASGEVVAYSHASIQRIDFSHLTSRVDGPRGAGLSFELLPNHPNPFNPSTTVALRLAVEGEARLTVRDLRGAWVRTLHQGRLPAGGHSRVWDGRNSDGVAVAGGVYLVVLEVGGQAVMEKVLLVK
jgi:hypothetical protein